MERITISKNQRFMMTEQGQPFFWLGDTAWLLFQKLSREEAAFYLKNRADKGFNVIQAVILHQPDNQNVYGENALYNKSITETFVNSSPDAVKDNSYWNHIDYIVGLAEKLGLYIGLLPVWGSVADSGCLNAANAAAYGSWLGSRYKERTNVFWILGGDTRGNVNYDVWNTLGNAIKKHDPEHLMTFHPFGRTQSSQWFHEASWLDFNMFQSGHRRYNQKVNNKEENNENIWIGQDNWWYVADDYDKKPIKPTLDGEPSYESIPQGLHDPSQPYWTSDDVRRYAYWSVFAGACGFTYGHNAVMQMHKPENGKGSYSVREYWNDALDAPGAFQMKHLAKLLLSVPYFERIPDQSVIEGDIGEQYERLLATRGSDYLFVYTYTGRSIRLKMGSITGKQVHAWWFIPGSGEMIYSGIYENEGVQEFAPPITQNAVSDYVLVLTDGKKEYFKI